MSACHVKCDVGAYFTVDERVRRCDGPEIVKIVDFVTISRILEFLTNRKIGEIRDEI